MAHFKMQQVKDQATLEPESIKLQANQNCNSAQQTPKLANLYGV
jgi:hypothetical protein